jgi:hypothetical protein
LDGAVAKHDTPTIFNWLVQTFSYQGISDQVARGYIERHGSADWAVLQRGLTHKGCCPKLRDYWRFEACQYNKGRQTCAEPDHFNACPLPRLPLRNGRLNQTAYSLFLFVRDIGAGDLVTWVDGQLATAVGSTNNIRQAARQEALIGPLRHVYGVSDKVLTMALSSLFLGTADQRPDWFETGASMVTIDTLVHNFLRRTGISQECGMQHPFGPACYGIGGCAEILRVIASQIDARQFNPRFPATFPRFVQHAIWRYCAADGLNICNGVKIRDSERCNNSYCRLGSYCDRMPLKTDKKRKISIL